MNIYQYIEDFKYGDNIIDFLYTVRGYYDQSHGAWHQQVDDQDSREIIVDIRTGGWSDNEAIVNLMLNNYYIRTMYYHAWERGGKHVFRFFQPQQ